MSKISFKQSDLWSLLIITIVGMILMFLGMVAVGNQPEVFNDFIIETVAHYGTNETGELRVFWIVLLLGIPLLLFVQHLLRKTKGAEEKKLPLIIPIELILSIANLIFFLFAGYFQLGLVMLAIFSFFNYLINPEKQKEALILNIITYYALLAVCSAVNWLGLNVILNSTILMIITGLVDLIILGIDKKHGILNNCLLLLQLAIPANLLLYVNERYSLNGEIIKLSMPTIVRVFFGGLIILFFAWSVFQLIKNWKKAGELDLSALVLIPAIMVIFVVNSIGTGTGLIVPEDLHHTAEEVISYQQIFGKGQEAYVDYSPVSGLFPVFIGAVLEAVGGNITEFGIAHTIFMMVIAMATIYVLSKHLDKDDTLLAACLFAFVNYDRAVFILISLLILLLPKLIKKRNLWLKLWMLISLVNGLYYPSFGGAILVGMLPLGIYQIYKLIITGELKKQLKTWKFYFWWIISFIPVILLLPMLLNMAKHIGIYSSQTNLADGISVFGQNAPDGFMPYLSDGVFNYARVAIYYAVRYVLPMLAVWTLAIVGIKAWKARKDEKNRYLVFCVLAGILTLLVAYVSTMVRQDVGNIVSRATHIIVPIFGTLLCVLIWRYMNKNIYSYTILGIIIGVVVVLGYAPITSLDAKFKYANELDEKYIQITNEVKAEYPRLGNGFIKKTDLEMFNGYRERAYSLLEYDPNLKFLGWGKLGVYYTLDLTTVGQPSLYAAKDYDTHQEIIDAIKEQKPVIGIDLSETLLNYYLYNWLLTTDEYVYDANYEAFLPVELFRKIYGETAEPTPKEQVPIYSTDIGRVGDSLGASLESLKNVMAELNIVENVEQNEYTYTVTLPDEVSGTEADMIFLDFEVDGWITEPEEDSKLVQLLSKQHYNDSVYVIISWGEEENEQMLSILGRGDILVPVGANASWLLDEHKDFKITVKNANAPLILNDIEFYKLRKEQ